MINIEKFIRESNMIEGIYRDPTGGECRTLRWFLDLPLSINTILDLLKMFQPTARLRNKRGMDVRVGAYLPSRGGYKIKRVLYQIIEAINEKALIPYVAHIQFEKLHPFTDGNGRVGRAIYLWMLSDREKEIIDKLGFLHYWYYQSLENSK